MFNSSIDKLLVFANSKIKRVIDSSLFKASGIYTLSSFLNASIPFLLLPILTKYLPPADFGLVSMFTTIIGFVMPFLSVNMEGAIARRYFSSKNNIDEYIGNCIIISLISSSLMLVFLFSFQTILFKLTGVPLLWIMLAVLLCFSQFIISILLTIYQVKLQPLSYGVFQITQSGLNMGLSLLFIVGFNLKAEGRMTGQLLASVLVSIVAFSLLFFKKNLSFKLNWAFIEHALKYGGGLIPHALGSLLIIYTNRFFLLNMFSIEEAGLYSVASQVSSVIGFFTDSFVRAYVPWLYTNLNLNDDLVKLKIVKFTYICFIFLILLSILFYFGLPLLFSFFINTQYVTSLKYCFWIIAGLVFQGMYYMVTNYITYSEKTYYQALVTLSVGVVNIALNYLFIKQFGAVGAAMAFCFSYFLMFICTWYVSNKLYKMPWFLTLNK